jgi:hypothetical protein
MGVLKGRSAAVQDGHQIDHCVMPVHELLQLGGVVNVGFHHGQAGQALHL